MLRNKKIGNALIVAAALAIPLSAAPTAFADENTNQTTTNNTNHAVSVQKLYANVYDQENGQFLGRYLLDVENGYTDSPHRMFKFYSFPQIDGYGYVSNPPSMIPVDWTNPSGITDMKVYVVKKSSDVYKKTYGISDSNSNQNTHHANHQSNNSNNNNNQTSDNKQSAQNSASSSSKQNSDQSEDSSSSKKADQSFAKPKKAKKSAIQTKSKHQTFAWPSILIGGAVLIIAAIAIIWGINKTRKPRKTYKHQKK